MILISKLQKMGRLKCHTQTFEDFYLSSSLIWLFGTNSPLKRHSKLWHSYLIVISCFLGFNIHPLLWIVPYDWCVTHMRHTQKICILSWLQAVVTSWNSVSSHSSHFSMFFQSEASHSQPLCFFASQTLRVFLKRNAHFSTLWLGQSKF